MIMVVTAEASKREFKIRYKNYMYDKIDDRKEKKL